MGRFGRTAKKKKKPGKSLVPHLRVASPLRYPHSEEGLILIPAQDWLWSEAVVAQQNLEHPPGAFTHVMLGSGGPAEKRNVGVKTVLDDPSVNWIFFLDSDMTPEPKTVMKLLAHDVPIAGALCYMRVAPFAPAVGLLPGQTEVDVTSGPFEVASTGGAALLVRREVLEALAPGPYFEYTPGRMHGEDVNFCRAARKAGFPILIDPDITVGHLGAASIDRHFAAAWGKAAPILAAAKEERGVEVAVPRENAHGA